MGTQAAVRIVAVVCNTPAAATVGVAPQPTIVLIGIDPNAAICVSQATALRRLAGSTYSTRLRPLPQFLRNDHVAPRHALRLAFPSGGPILVRMSKAASKARKDRPGRRSSRRGVTVPAEFWSQLLTALQGLRVDVRRLADVASQTGDGRRLDWQRFAESRAAAAQGREKYWREVGTDT